MTPTAIVLAGGFGTRLQSVVKDIPKPMAPVHGEPFLWYLIRHLYQMRIKKIILSVGYKSEIVQERFGKNFSIVELEYSVEDEPLGTGGAIYKAIKQSDEEDFLVVNGDTLFEFRTDVLYQKHRVAKSLLSVALKPMTKFDRYGRVLTDASHRITSFEEKGFFESGDINGGFYVLNRKVFDHVLPPEKFSFEKDVLEKYYKTIPMYGFPFDGYFIDIGIPEDYERAQKEFRPPKG